MDYGRTSPPPLARPSFPIRWRLLDAAPLISAGTQLQNW
jgi:hypothetical protein